MIDTQLASLHPFLPTLAENYQGLLFWVLGLPILLSSIYLSHTTRQR